MTELDPRAIGAPLERTDGRAKVTGTAAYAFEQPVADPLYVHPVQSTIARGRIRHVDTDTAADLEGVVAVLTHLNAPGLAEHDPELHVLQSPEIAFRGQPVAAVLAETPEIARHAAGLVRVDYEQEEHDVVLRADHPQLYAPEVVNPSFPTDTAEGDPEASAEVEVDHEYSTPMEHNNPMEPHATVAVWAGGHLTLHDSTQGVHKARSRLAPVLGLPEERIRVVSPHVGGGFGSKGTAHAHNVLAALAARGDDAGFDKTLGTALRGSMLVVIPLTAYMMAVALPTLGFIFEGGCFSAEETILAAPLLQMLLLSVPFWVVQQVIGRAFYARQNTLTPAIVGTVATLAALPAYPLAVKLWGAFGVAMLTTLCLFVYTLALSWFWIRKHGTGAFDGMGHLLLKGFLLVLPGTLLAFSAVYGLSGRLPLWFPSLYAYLPAAMRHAAICGIAGVIFAVPYLLLAKLFMPEALSLRRRR